MGYFDESFDSPEEDEEKCIHFHTEVSETTRCRTITCKDCGKVIDQDWY